ncbi:TRAP transporter substrate-binding protein [Salipiger mucosus]|uniref:TRAP-type C4-dicarboxylate transport system, periplasmic component n=1 Tax=Salipiger mucosus DSM 16094 TaxID=1123237 RepID=S9QPS8_9RHOB|nr:TRAP transporter substrate-binding protein [Salipiger mucosus]EPX83446.1 TRAP-type C4-dicarboxylate transport system, periplasmic component [Salipiger mucosus DSM 16094]
MATRMTAIAAGTILLAGAVQAEDVIFAHGENPGNPRYIAAEKWAELYSECTGSSVNVAPSATMGDDVEMLTSVGAGIIQITANSQGSFSQIVPEIGLLGLPFLFPDLETAWATVDGEVGKMIDEKAHSSGLKVVGYWDNGIRHITHLSKHMLEPADLAGMRIRTPPAEMTVDIFEALGASPAPLAWSEVPSALQSGVFEGQENPLTNIYFAKLHEITPYITLTGHMYEASPVVVGLAWWEGLDEATQTCVTDATRQAGTLQRQLNKEGNEQLQATMEEEGAVFATANREAFVEATASVYDKYAETYPDLVAALREAAQGQ